MSCYFKKKLIIIIFHNNFLLFCIPFKLKEMENVKIFLKDF